MLHNFIVWDMAHNADSLSKHARQLLKRLVVLAKAAYVPAPLAQYKNGCVKRASKETVTGKHSLHVATDAHCLAVRFSNPVVM